MRKTILIILAISTFFSCSVLKQDLLKINKIPFQLITKGNLTGAGNEGICESNIIIKTKKDWDTLLLKLNSSKVNLYEFSDLSIDFDKNIILACFDGVKNSGGYSIDVVDVIEYRRKVRVYYTKAKLEGPSTQAIIQPFVIVKVPKTRKEYIITEAEKIFLQRN